MSFDSLGLSTDLLRAVGEQGYTEPTPIQRKAIPVILAGKDVMAGAQTGTGKTAGFTLPLLQRLADKPITKGKRPVRALVLTPTRELAAQVGESVDTYGRHTSLRSTVIFGGVKINPQIAKLRQGVDILIATPGRLLDHASQGTVDLSRVEILVLDEADRMLDMGFIHDIRKVLSLLPANGTRQNLLFSATFSNEIKKLAGQLLDHPELIEVARRNTTAERIKQVIHPVDKRRKREMLSHMIGSGNWQQVLVFTRTKHGANRLAQQLERDGLTAAAIHGNKSQGARTRALAGFKNGKVRVLVATDIAARGLDIDQLPHVVNYELPNVPEDYVHRIGRTGRAGNEGEAISLVCVDEHKLLKDIERLLKGRIPQVTVEGYEPDPTIKAEPVQKQRNNNPRNNDRRAAGSNNRSRDGKKGSAGKSQQSAKRHAVKDQQKGKNPRKHNRVNQAEEAAKPRRHSAVKRKKETAALLGG
ncbi:MAG: ATP-dependent RNA helicase RhlE [Candidatus Thiodiazotropha weberae]|uniref:ATP-dependent RNA helicase RhlE n=1 Tax=Candidatus Thiodiazotropha endoloripes TaxID=1818881 RepID=UPI000903A3FA|nr:ATP-dependent RNA helicase RhlE [Candidatus Thiodiazotropha endoloripes]MCG7897575.1 ATP-dependent RNA helicase RhlE [Candidatus Thiodiazotropha weberae]MCG7900843.1 ATP-dependent RNA helicase RhlE [Candidatus Thiodiazotropha weberae]MCG7914813.1 ATP-dependent RNA helicase RhlE [Candidatus Thiodiazotropha weberae]